MSAIESYPALPLELTRREFIKAASTIAGGLLVGACTSPEGANEPGEPVIPHVAVEQAEIREPVDLIHKGQWSYVDGVRRTGDTLSLEPTGSSIINKRQKGRIEPNPPLNVFGTRLQTEGDFTVGATIAGDVPVAMQLYGIPPIRFDDFRYERSRLECMTGRDAMTVRIWNDTSQEPMVQQFSFSGRGETRSIEIRRQGDALLFYAGGEEVGRTDKGKLFDGGEIWLGLNSESAPAQVSNLYAKPGEDHRLWLLNTEKLHVTKRLPEGLQSLVRKPGFTIGAAVALNPLVADHRYAQIFLGGELGSVTTENALKPQDTQPVEGTFTFGEAEALVALAQRHGVAVHGHTPVYDRAMPTWMLQLPHETTADKQRVRDVLEQHVETVVRQFQGRIGSWDVVNEAVDGFNDNVKLRENIWYKALGEEYIDVAFRTAHRADPNARLYINDYGFETNPQGRGRFILSLADRLLSRGVPIDGIGIEGHVYEIPRDTIKSGKLRKLMDDIGRLGLKARVSELDVTGKHGAKAQSAQYGDVLKTCLEAPNCSGLSLWGLTDAYGSTSGIRDGKLKNGDALPYTADYRPKIARRAMLDALRAS
jgi:endo-1,4-beta-xylanase